MKRTLILCAAIAGALYLLSTCTNNSGPVLPPGTNGISAVPLPTNIVPGFKFPEDTTIIINQWLGNYTAPYFDTVSIYRHAWGIWAGLTAKTNQVYKGDSLLVFETWPGIFDIQQMVKNGQKDCKWTKNARSSLAKPNQLGHARNIFRGNLHGSIDTVNEEGSNFWVSVSYDPTAACHTVKNSLLDSSVLAGMIQPNQIRSIQAFPRTAITLKPTYLVGRASDSLIMIPAWPGPPTPAVNYPDTAWHSYVWVDVHNRQAANKPIIPVRNANPTPAEIAAATCNLNDFIHYKLDQTAADYLNKQQNLNAKAGDLAILVAMHVGTKEISNWTWQTFFWAPDPANPPFPSNKVAATNRPAQLQGAAAHYALSVAYAMVRPNQPISGGTNKGVSAEIGYNPYLEPNLGPINSKSFPNQLNPAMMWGVQSNCMSCHALASYPGNNYTADQYIDMKDAGIFAGKVQLDFAWSIQQNVVASKK